MKKLILAGFAALSLMTAVVSVAQASTTEDLSGATRMQQTGAYTR